MRFTIQGLLLVMLFLALPTGIYLNRKTARESTELDQRLRSELHTAQLDMLKLPEDQRQLHLDRNEFAPQWSIDQFEKVTQRLEAVFDREAAKVKLITKDDQLGIISIPVMDPREIHRKWLASIPEDSEESFWLVVRLTGFISSSTHDESTAVDLQLTPGQNMIEVRFDKLKKRLLFRVNGQLLVDREVGDKDESFQSRWFTVTELQAKTQQDFASDESLPDLIVYPKGLYGFEARINRGAPL